MDDIRPHLSEYLIQQFAKGTVTLNLFELRHFHECEQCSEVWWRYKQELKRAKKNPKTSSGDQSA